MMRRTFVGWLVRGVAAAATADLLLTDARSARPVLAGAPADAATSGPEPAATGPVAVQAVAEPEPVAVRMADMVLAGRDLRTGQADGVRLPAQGGDAWALAAERPGATYTTPPLQAEFACSHVGVRWRTDGGDQEGVRVALRTSRDGQSWLPWRAVPPEAHGPDRSAARGALASEPETFGVLLGGRQARWLQVRLTFEQAGPLVAEVRGITLTCLDSRRPPVADAPPVPITWAAGSPTSGLLAPRARAGGRSVGDADMLRAGITGFLDRVVSREAWGADEALRFKDGVNQWPTAFVAPSLLVVHHTAGDHDIVDAEAEVRAIYAYHAVTQGWGDIGYHLLIDSSGRVYEGRRGREPDADGLREIVSENVVAGHALDYNYGSIGIALVGNFQTHAPGQPMLDVLVDALAFMAIRYKIDPTAEISYARVRGDGTALWRDELDAVSGHRDCIPTECPGDNVYRLLSDIRERVDEQLGARGPAVRITHAPADRNLWPTDLGFAWQGDARATEVSTMLAGWRRIPGTDTIEALSGYTGDQRPTWGPWTQDGALSVPLPPDARGIYTLFVRARDAAGREARIAARSMLVVDRHVVVDDADTARTEYDGAWQPDRGILGYNGSQYLTAGAGAPAARFRWYMAVPISGTYAVQACWTEAGNRTTQAVYRVRQQDTVLHSATVDQQTVGGHWATLGEVPVDAELPCIVELEGDAPGALVADAIRLVLVP